MDADALASVDPSPRFEWLLELIDCLEPLEREAVEAVFFEGVSTAVAAERHGITPFRFEGALRRAYDRIERAVRVRVEMGQMSAEDIEASPLLRALVLDHERD